MWGKREPRNKFAEAAAAVMPELAEAAAELQAASSELDATSEAYRQAILRHQRAVIRTAEINTRFSAHLTGAVSGDVH